MGRPSFYIALFFTLPFSCFSQEKEDVVLVVDKGKNQLHLARHEGLGLRSFKVFPVTLGLVEGNKMVEGDLKTPEGIYRVEFRVLPESGLKPKFGSMALYLSYPNHFDRLGKKTGYDILIHGTNKPSRLEKKYDSKGCVVLSNEMLEEVWSHVKLKQTIVIITSQLGEVLQSSRREKLQDFVERWLGAWRSKDINRYINSYAYEFTYEKLNLIQYRKKKEALNKRYHRIAVEADNIKYYFHEHYDLVVFDQSYRSTDREGRTIFAVGGKKALYMQLRNGQYRILIENLSKN